MHWRTLSVQCTKAKICSCTYLNCSTGPRSRELWDEHISGSPKSPSFDKLKTFLQRRLQTLERRLPAKEAKTKAASSKTSAFKNETKSHMAQKKKPSKNTAKTRCSLCKNDHFLMFCEGFQSKTAKGRKDHVSYSSLCINCFGKHKAQECMSQKSCTVCGERHHTLLRRRVSRYSRREADAYKVQYFPHCAKPRNKPSYYPTSYSPRSRHGSLR